ncbi:protein kinase [Streptomyces sp. NPDC058657]|uniref:serine/threonine-protein kinase n=1 Tax=unclassified Streptomyces TaxID=2593676 RepID=UPI00365F1082
MEPLISEDPPCIGPYRLIARLGAGGMGLVYLGRSDVGRTVAVKVVLAEYARNADFRRRFAHEVAAARRVGGAWTAAVLDADTQAPVPWVATQFVAGPSLQAVVAQDFGPLPEASVRALANGLARALADIHAAGLIHRDLKPQNVLVTVDGPRVIDFGIARAMDTLAEGAMTRTGAVVGSPGFMSPEQVRGQRLTPASDIFCLGSVLAYAATGRSPFGTADSGLHALMFRVAEEEPDLDGVPEPLLGLVRQCLAKNPAHRPTPQDVGARTAMDPDELWLPGPVLRQLGRTAAQLLDFAPPSVPEPTVVSAPATAPSPTSASAPVPLSTSHPVPGPANTHRDAHPTPHTPVLPPPAGPSLHNAPTGPAPTPPAPSRRNRRPFVVAASVATGLVVLVGGLIAFRSWGTGHGDGGSGANKASILPEGFTGTWEGIDWAVKSDPALARLKVTGGGIGDKVTEYSLRFKGHMCVYSGRLTSVSDANTPGSATIHMAAATLERAEPQAAAKDCAAQPAMALKGPKDGKFELSGSVDTVNLKKDPLGDPATKVLDPFRGPWRAQADALDKYDRFDLKVFGPGQHGLGFRTEQNGEACHYLAEPFAVWVEKGRESKLYTAPAKLRTPENEGAPAPSDPGCAKDGPVLNITLSQSGGLQVDADAPLTGITLEIGAELTKTTD